MMRRVVVYPDAATVATATAARLLTELTDILAHQDRADVVVTGGTVGIATLRAVADNPVAQAVDWTAVHLWWGDERFVAAGDPDRNEGQAQEALIERIPIPAQNVHRMGSATEYSTVETAAAAYHDDLAHNGNPQFDVLMLGVGPDGHVASLFPEHPALDVSGVATVGVHGSPKPPPLRVSLTFDAIRAAREVWIVAAGAEKASAVASALSSAPVTTTPAAGALGTAATRWLIDAAASEHLPRPDQG